MSIILDSSQLAATNNIVNWFFSNKPYYILGGVAGSGKSTCVASVIERLNSENKLTT